MGKFSIKRMRVSLPRWVIVRFFRFVIKLMPTNPQNGVLMMKMMTGLCVGIAFCGLSVVAMAADYQWKLDGRVNDWDWTDSRNFVLKGTESEGAPQANDTVFVPDGLMVKARSSDATSCARGREVGRVEPRGRTPGLSSMSRMRRPTRARSQPGTELSRPRATRAVSSRRARAR